MTINASVRSVITARPALLATCALLATLPSCVSRATMEQEVAAKVAALQVAEQRTEEALVESEALRAQLQTAQAQRPSAAPQTTPRPTADPADVASIDAIMTAVYDVISGPAGQARDWDRMLSLFAPGARLIPTGLRPDGSVGHSMLSPEDYRDRAGASLVADGFFEVETHRLTERYGPIAHCFSSYAARRSLDDPEPFMRGINSFQLLHDGDRWWVLTIYWTPEREDLPIPAQYGG